MGWKARLGGGALSFMVISGTLVYGIPAAQAASGMNGTGNAGTCSTPGKINFGPALLSSWLFTTNERLSFHSSSSGTCSGATGDGVHVIRSKWGGVGKFGYLGCNLLGQLVYFPVSITVKWNTNGTEKLNPSSILVISATFSRGFGNEHGAVSMTGVVRSGSFNSDSFSASIEDDQTGTTLSSQFAGKGVKQITFGRRRGSDGISGNASVTISK